MQEDFSENAENNIVIEDIILFKMRVVKISVISLITLCLFITIAIIILQILS